MTAQQLIDRLSEAFYARLTAKTGWGRNEIKLAFMEATIEALAAHTDLEVQHATSLATPIPQEEARPAPLAPHQQAFLTDVTHFIDEADDILYMAGNTLDCEEYISIDGRAVQLSNIPLIP